MFCGFCGQRVDDDAKFCPNCGGKTEISVNEAELELLHAGKETAASAAAQVYQPPAAEPEPRRKPGPGVFVGVVILAAAVFAGTFLGISYFMKGSANGNTATGQADTGMEAGKENPETLDPEIPLWSGAADESVDLTAAAETLPDLASADGSSALAVTEPANGINRYEIVIKDSTWTQAWQECIAKGGHLVHFDTLDEYDHVKGLISSRYSNIKFWIGGARPAGSYEYHWINGDGTYQTAVINSPEYTSLWMQGEPSFSDEGIEEQYMNIFYYKKENRWVWNDVPNDIIAIVNTYAGKVGYICEYE